MADAPMRYLFTLFGVKFYFADKNFVYQGIYIWNGKNNVRIIPFNKFFK